MRLRQKQFPNEVRRHSFLDPWKYRKSITSSRHFIFLACIFRSNRATTCKLARTRYYRKNVTIMDIIFLVCFSRSYETLKSKAPKKRIPKKRKKATLNISEFESSPKEKDVWYIYCRKFYFKDGSLTFCHLWSHNSCAGTDSENDEPVFSSELCQ